MVDKLQTRPLPAKEEGATTVEEQVLKAATHQPPWQEYQEINMEISFLYYVLTRSKKYSSVHAGKENRQSNELEIELELELD